MNFSLNKKDNYLNIHNTQLNLNTISENIVFSSINFSKITISLLKNKPYNMIKYMCYRKPENLIFLLNNVINRSICDIILKILMIDNQNIEELANFDNLKTKIIFTLLTNFYTKDSLEEITNTKDIFIELIETTKNFEFLVSENFLIIFFSTLVSIKSLFSLKEYLLVLIALIKQFKTEYEKAQKFVSSLSLSMI